MVLYGLRMYENKLFLFEKARESVMSAFVCCRIYCMKIKGFFGSIMSWWGALKLKKGFIYLQLRCWIVEVQKIVPVRCRRLIWNGNKLELASR